MKPPIVNLDIKSFWDDPYPALAVMRKETPICYVPELQAIILTRHHDIFKCEKMVDIFSSDQPAGLMDLLMGKNMMRKDGVEHFRERKQARPALSTRTVKDTWKSLCERETDAILDSKITKFWCRATFLRWSCRIQNGDRRSCLATHIQTFSQYSNHWACAVRWMGISWSIKHAC